MDKAPDPPKSRRGDRGGRGSLRRRFSRPYCFRGGSSSGCFGAEEVDGVGASDMHNHRCDPLPLRPEVVVGLAFLPRSSKKRTDLYCRARATYQFLPWTGQEISLQNPAGFFHKGNGDGISNRACHATSRPGVLSAWFYRFGLRATVLCYRRVP